MTALPPIAVPDREAAAMLRIPLEKFRWLVSVGALPQPRRIGPFRKRRADDGKRR